jgi:hypothetical protein
MNTASTHQNRRPFARVIDAVTAFFGECSYAQTRLAWYPPKTAARS